jgi:hypothetical protein
MAGIVMIPWYATLMRAEKLEVALQEIAPVALRYGASMYHVHRSRDDRYRFQQFSHFESKDEWERFWYGEEFIGWRADYSGWYQVPVVYEWQDLVTHGTVATEAELRT